MTDLHACLAYYSDGTPNCSTYCTLADEMTAGTGPEHPGPGPLKTQRLELSHLYAQLMGYHTASELGRQREAKDSKSLRVSQAPGFTAIEQRCQREAILTTSTSSPAGGFHFDMQLMKF